MASLTQGHLHRNGDIDFPLWVKAVGGILAICTPLGLTLMGWLAITVVEMKTDLKYAAQDKWSKTDHIAYSTAQQERDNRQNERILVIEKTIDTIHGRR